jgi:hypothetical protein
MSWTKSLTCATIVGCVAGCSSASHTPDSSELHTGGGTNVQSAGNAGRGGSANASGGNNLGGVVTQQGGSLSSAGQSNELAAAGSAGASETTGTGGAPSYGGAVSLAGSGAIAGTTALATGGTTAAATGGRSTGGTSGGVAGISTGGVVVSTGGVTAGGSANGSAGSAGHSNAGAAGTGVAGTAGTTLGAVCGTGYQIAQLNPVYMVFMYDKSGSMGDDPNGLWQNQSTRWAPMKLGMIDFFTNSGTMGIAASLRFFPAPGDKTTTCHADYATPHAAMTSLQTPAPLIDALNATVPGGGTPTLPAVMGGIAYAKQLMLDHPGSKAVVVLVTDGEPAIYNPTTTSIEIDCAPVGSTLTNTIADIVSVTDAAYRGTLSVPTYVIGIGEAQSEMSAIATAGGTEFIQLDATQPPEQTRTKLTTALQSIRTMQFQCGMPIPFGAGFRKELLSVSFKHSNGSIEGLSKSATCSNAGFYFDNEAAPSQIILCPSTCAAIQNDLAGTLQLKLACES